MVDAIEAITDFYQRVYGLTATSATFVLDIEESTYERHLGTIGFHYCGSADGSLIFVIDACAFPFIIAHEFAHVVLGELAGEHWGSSRPTWLAEGAADYLALQWWLAERDEDPEAGWDSRETFAAGVIQDLSQGPTGLPPTASDAEVARAAIEKEEAHYDVYTLAVRHLVERFGIAALLAVFSPAWSTAGHDDASRFQAVVGESLDDFYASFGRWLRALPAPPPDPWSSAAPDVPPACAIAGTDTRGVDWVNFDTLEAECITVRDGGVVKVIRGDLTRTFTLYGGWNWRVFDATNGVPAVQFENPANPYLGISSGFIRFALDDGRELAREVPADTPDLDAIFDAIVRLSAAPAD